MKISDIIQPKSVGRPKGEPLTTIKAARLNLSPGQTVDFTITSDVQPLSKREWYTQVTSKVVDGNYRLTSTSLTILSRKLGDDTANWIGGRFTGFVTIARNPRTNEQTVGFAILADSVRSAKTK